MADGDFNLATLWLPVAPETSKVGPAMEEAGKQAKSKFGQGVKGIGDTIHDDLAKASTKVKDTFAGVGKSITDILAKTGADSSKSLADSFKAESGPLRTLVDTTNHARDGVRNLGNAFVDLKSGNVSGALERANNSLKNMDDSARKVGLDLEHLGVPKDATDSLAKLNSTSNELGKHLEEARGGIERLGKSGGGLSGLIGKLGEVGVVAAAIKEALNGIKDADQWLENKMPWYKGLDEQFKHNPINSWFSGIFGDKPSGTAPPMPNPFTPGSPLNNMLLPGGAPGAPGQAPSSQNPWLRTNSYKGYGTPEPFSPEPEPAPSAPSRGGSGGASGRPSGSSGIGSPSSPSGLHAAGSRVAYLYALAASLQGTPYSQQLRNDCSGMVAQLSAAALGMAPPAAGDRFSTSNEGSWLLSHGFQEGMGGPGDMRVGWYDHGGGNLGHTAATLPGGEHAESGGSHGAFLVGPGAAGADSSQFEHHAFLHMSGANSGSGSGDDGPLGSREDPLYTTQADTGDSGSGSGGGSSFQNQGQQLGQGLVNGLLQMVGLDGSVFGGKSPLDWGAVKMGMGALNWGLGAAKTRAGVAGMAGGGGGGGAGGLSALGGLLSPGAALSASAAGGSLGIGAGGQGGTTIHNDNSINVSGNTVGNPDELTQRMQWQQNATPPGSSGRAQGALSGVPAGP